MAADETPRSESSAPSTSLASAGSPGASDISPHIRLRVDVVVEIADAEALTRAALDRVRGDELMPDEERAHASEIVAADAGEAIAYLVDPFDLVRELPGVELAHASWGSEEVAEADIDALAAFDDLDQDLDLDLDQDMEPDRDPEGDLNGTRR